MSYIVRLPKSADPIFPEICLLCGLPTLERQRVATGMAKIGLTDLPAHEKCVRSSRLKKILFWTICGILISAYLGALVYLIAFSTCDEIFVPPSVCKRMQSGDYQRGDGGWGLLLILPIMPLLLLAPKFSTQTKIMDGPECRIFMFKNALAASNFASVNKAIVETRPLLSW